MTKFVDPKFSVAVGGKAYSDGWERIFGKKKEEKFDCLECKDTGKMLAEDPQHGHVMKVQCRCQNRERHT